MSLDEIVVDLFAGGGGASEGITWALGRHPDIAVNHDPDAIEMHRLNHPLTEHWCENVFKVAPRDACRGHPVGLLWASPDCFPAGTMVLTTTGYRPIEGIVVGDMVLTHNLRYMRVNATYHTKKSTVSVRGYGHPGLKMSAEHPIYIRTRKDIWHNPTRRYNAIYASPEWIAPSQLREGSYWGSPVVFPQLPIPPVGGRGMVLDEKLLWLAGHYVGNGWTRITDTRAELVISCNKKRRDEIWAHLDQWPRAQRVSGSNELSWHERDTLTARQISTNHRGLVQWLRTNFGHTATAKFVPSWLLGADTAFKQAFLDGYMAADGYYHKINGKYGKYECTTVSKSLAYGIKALANSLGKSALVYQISHPTDVIQGRHVKVHTAYSVRWVAEPVKKHQQVMRDGGIEWSAIKEQTMSPDVVDVYNIGVEQDESYVAEGIIVHNCTHHSSAKGGKPRSQKLRSLAWVVVRWARDVKPRTIVIENVREFLTWGPLLKNGQPDPKRAGETFTRFVRELRNLGYVIDWRVLNAADYGAPTARRRLFMIARCDGVPVTWPVPTHGPDLTPWRTAASIIDTTIPVPSIFTRPRPLAEATCARIAAGIRKFVLQNPYFMEMQVGDGQPRGDVVATFLAKHYGGVVGIPMTVPLSTITTKDHHALVAVSLSQYNGESIGGAVDSPLSTITSQNHHALVAVSLTQYNGESIGARVDRPTPTVTTKDRFALVAAHLVKFYGTCKHGSSVGVPLPTITGGGGHHFGLVASTLSEEYTIQDIGMRFLTPRELARAQGFTDEYVLRGTKTRQIHLIGNSVCPPMAAAIVKELMSHQGAQLITDMGSCVA